MKVLGTTNHAIKPIAFDPTELCVSTNLSSHFPEIFCPVEYKIAVQVIMFERPSPTHMQYMSLNPIPLALGERSSSGGTSSQLYDIKKQERPSSKLVEKLRLHTVCKRPLSPKELSLCFILNQIISSLELSTLLSNNLYLIGTRQRRSLSVSERMVESATTLWELAIFATWRFWKVWLYPILTRFFIMGLICHRVIAEVVLYILEWRPHPESAALKDVSATAQQVDIRLQQFCYWPIQYATLRRRRDNWESITDNHPDYIRFYNSFWLVANDVIIGMALGFYIIDHSDWVATQINRVLSGWTVEGLQRMIKWLMGSPAGLKLNNELALFLGDLFLWVIDYWSGMAFSQVTLKQADLMQAVLIAYDLFCLTLSLSLDSRALPEPACPYPCFQIFCLFSLYTSTLSTLHPLVFITGNGP